MLDDMKYVYRKFDEKMAPYVPVLILYMAIYVISVLFSLL